MDYVLKNSNLRLTDSQRQLARRLKISDSLLLLLLGRGMREEDIQGFLHPSPQALGSPFDIKGMAEAAERIKRAIASKEKILIYGDYDCDGICAISILMLYLRDRADVWYFIPDRNRDGYGVTTAALDRMFSSKKPDLVITVDCGITAVDEVEYIKARGVDVIVTDHHEPQDVIPSCIVVDPKIERKGFYELCGAGVALRLVEALSSRDEANKYLDIAAIATIADVVPLLNDNRIIASFGLKQIIKSPRKGIKMLVGSDAVTSQDVMFKLAPRMNAAGRLGSAMKVVGLFLESDYFMLKTLSEELARDNSKRQDMCEVAVEEAKAMLRGVDFNRLGIISLYSENWESGILGIAAARLVEEFKRPAVLFAKNGEELKGSARSVPEVNIFELFNNLTEYFTSFGGHAQAAGVGMKAEMFEAFCKAANDMVLSERPPASFIPPVVCEMELDLNSDVLSFAKELELLEPTGYQNPKPTLLIGNCNCRFDRIGFSQHIKCSGKNLDIIGFSRFANGLTYYGGSLDMEVTLGLNVFQNRLTAQAQLRSFRLKSLEIADGDAACMNAHQLDCEPARASNIEGIDIKGIEELIKAPFGTLIIAFCKDDVTRLYSESAAVKRLPLYIGETPCLNPETAVLLCPAENFDFGFYDNVIIAGDPLCEGYIAKIARASKCYGTQGISVSPPNISDELLRGIYRELVALSKRPERPNTARKLYASISSRIKLSEQAFIIATRIFKELSLVQIGDKGQISVSGHRVELNDSRTYRNLRSNNLQK